VVIHVGDDLELGPIGQLDPAHHVHLPQLHRTLTLPPSELVSTLATTPELDQPVAAEAAVDARSPRHRLHADPAQLVLDPPGSPAGMLAAELADHRLDLGADLMRTAVGSP
jgi:hypothetical protein